MLSKSKVKYIQSLAHKKHRDEENLFIIEGPKMVAELLTQYTGDVVAVYATKEWIESSVKRGSDLELNEVTADELAKISQLQTPNQALAIVRKPAIKPINLAVSVTLALDNIQDPGNLGTIIRIADWFGIPQLLCSPNCADLFNPKVAQATMGSIMRVQVHYIDLANFLKDNHSISTFAAALNGINVTTMKPLQEGIIVIGNESKGISDEIFALVKNKITIPGKGQAESLNAAVAAGIILSHLIQS